MVKLCTRIKMLKYFPVFYCIFLTIDCCKFDEIDEILIRIKRIQDFTLINYNEINLDGLLGLTIAQALLQESLTISPDFSLKLRIDGLVREFGEIRRKIEGNLPKFPQTMDFLLDPQNWWDYLQRKKFSKNELLNLDIYRNWTEETFLNDTKAEFQGIPTDFCLLPALQFEKSSCKLDDLDRFCFEMMLKPRIDNGYLLSHRLLFYQIIKMKNCRFPSGNLPKFYCSLMLKEAKTNEKLQFPARDIFLEQILLCGIEDFTEFLQQNWRDNVKNWQTISGCYQDNKLLAILSKRTSNIISFGCSDHTTGLAAAVLALNLKFLLLQC